MNSPQTLENMATLGMVFCTVASIAIMVVVYLTFKENKEKNAETGKPVFRWTPIETGIATALGLAIILSYFGNSFLNYSCFSGRNSVVKGVRIYPKACGVSTPKKIHTIYSH